MARLCIPLEDVSAQDLSVAGGKGANLGELIRAGFDVPRGFVVTTESYRSAVAGIGRPTREAITSAGVPDEVREAVTLAYDQLGSGPVAVRSSATAEDLPGAAFAGQQDTFLNIVGAEAVVQAVRDCWASLWTERAIAYRSRLDVPDESVAMAVVVQELVPAEWAGVLFTANPVTGARDQVIIDASPGLGEAVVSGTVTPDHVVVAADGAVIERHAGSREVLVRPTPGGGTSTETGDPRTAPLADSVLVRLATQGRAVAAHFGSPQDIEWALTGHRIHLTQARPMTALPPAPLRLNRFQRILGPVIMELLPRRPLPMELSAWSADIVLSHLGRMLDGIAGVRIDEAATLPTRDGIVQAYVPATPRPTLRTPARLARSVMRAARLRASDWRQDPLAIDIAHRARDLAELEVHQAEWTDLLAVQGRVREAVIDLAELRGKYLPSTGQALAALSLALVAAGSKEGLGDVAAGGDTQTMRANAALEAMAVTVRADPALHDAFLTSDEAQLLDLVQTSPTARVLREQLADFGSRFGHRETTSLMLLKDPSWGDSPSTVLGLVRVMLTRSAEPGAAPSPATSPSEDRPAAVLERVLGAPRARLLRARAWLGPVVRSAREGIALREDTHFEITRFMPVLRRAVVEVGERLAAAGWLDRPDDVWYLQWGEVAALADPSGPAPRDRGRHEQLRATVVRRKNAYATLAASPLIASATLYPDRPASGTALLTGLPGGGGRATGPVRVIRHPDEFGAVAAGEVLVCPATNPAWTPLFARVAAVVVDHGGSASHAAIVAREYGIAAVLATGTGTSTLTTGMRVTVDGDHGVVSPADDATRA